MEFLTQEQVEKIQKIGLFDFIAQEKHNLSKEEIASLFKEFNYAVYSLDKEIEKKAVAVMVEELKEY